MENHKPCRHEYVKIYQRKLKGLDRRLVATRAYLPIGFKQTDFAHLSEGSYCFCTKCRARLFPRRTAAEKAQARLVAVQSKALAEAGISEETSLNIAEGDFGPEAVENVVDNNDGLDDKDIHVEELELENVDVQDIEAEGVKLGGEERESDNLTEGEDI
jgi:hypothetical protein